MKYPLIISACLIFQVACNEPAKTTSGDLMTDTVSVQRKTKPSKNIMLTEYRWKLTELSGKVVGDSVNGQEPSITFSAADSSIGGRVGCNRFGGKYFADDLTIKFFQVFSTKMACQDMWVENTLLGMMDSLDRYSVSEKELVLAQGLKKVAVFEAMPLK